MAKCTIEEMKQTIHVEFYGLPGCGKSTISAIVAEQLRAEGYIVKELSREIDHGISKKKRKILKLLRYVCYVSKNPKQLVKIRKLVQVNGYFGTSEIFQMVNVVQKLKAYNEECGKQIVIWDEGLTQAAISLAVNDNVSSLKNESYMLKLCPKNVNVIRIYIKGDINTVLKRLEKRANGNSRVEREKDLTKKEQMLNQFVKGCEEMKSDFCIYGDGKTPEENAKEIMDFIHSYISLRK